MLDNEVQYCINFEFIANFAYAFGMESLHKKFKAITKLNLFGNKLVLVIILMFRLHNLGFNLHAIFPPLIVSNLIFHIYYNII